MPGGGPVVECVFEASGAGSCMQTLCHALKSPKPSTLCQQTHAYSVPQVVRTAALPSHSDPEPRHPGLPPGTASGPNYAVRCHALAHAI